MADSASDYHRGEMDIHAQKGTYEAVMNGSKWGSLTLAAALFFLVLWFCTSAGFVGGAIGGIVVAVIGFIVLRDKKTGPAH